jgi:hypothetical protein
MPRVLGVLADSSYHFSAVGAIASRYLAAYHQKFMLSARPILRHSVHFFRVLAIAILALLARTTALHGQDLSGSAATMALADVRPGMQGYAYTIFAGDQVEKFDLVVLGVLENFLGPRQSIILVQLKGTKVEYTGVVAGMSGSPVYLEGKLAGALSLKLGVFTKDPIAGVTPIRDVMNPLAQNTAVAAQNLPLPEQAASSGAPTGSALEPIETPLVFSGFPAASLNRSHPKSKVMVLSPRKAAPRRPGLTTENWLLEIWPAWCWSKGMLRSIPPAR